MCVWTHTYTHASLSLFLTAQLINSLKKKLKWKLKDECPVLTKFPNYLVTCLSWQFMKPPKHKTMGQNNTRSVMCSHRLHAVSKGETRFTETLTVYLKLGKMNCSVHLRFLIGAWPKEKSYWAFTFQQLPLLKSEEIVITVLWFFFRHKISHIVYSRGGKDINIAGPSIDFLASFCVFVILCVWGFCLQACLCTCMLGALRGQMMVLDLLQLELQRIEPLCRWESN